MPVPEMIAAHLPDQTRDQCRPILDTLLAAFQDGGAEQVTAVLLEQLADLETTFDRQLADLEKLL